MTSPVEFLLGTHMPGWLTKAGVPLFVSDVRLRGYKTLPVAAAPWALDSGGFSELQYHGRWTTTPEEYVARVRRYRDEIGHLMWAAPQDWMCEYPIIYGGQYGREKFVGTRQFLDPDRRLTHEDLIRLHLVLTVANYATLVRLDPTLPWVPVVQGSQVQHYLFCVDLYRELAGVDLTTMPLVGVGSICRRQNTAEAGEILAALHERGLLRKHLFGFKILGLELHEQWAWSADSLAGRTPPANTTAAPSDWACHTASCPAANPDPTTQPRTAPTACPTPCAGAPASSPLRQRPDPPTAALPAAPCARRVAVASS
jgi:hypothetical protein